MKRKVTKRRVFALILAIAMIVTLIPVTAMAGNDNAAAQTEYADDASGTVGVQEDGDIVEAVNQEVAETAAPAEPETQAPETAAPAPEPAQEETTAAPEPAQEETTAAPEQAEEETTAAPEQAEEETTAAPEQKQEETTAAQPETKKEETTKAEEETTKAEEETTKAEEENKMPAQEFYGNANGVTVSVRAPEGAFPDATKMVVTPVATASVIDAVEGALNSEVADMRAVDITFYNKEGKEIHPEKDIRVVLRAYEMDAAATSNDVVHIDDYGNAEVVGANVTGNKAVFSTDDFSVYVVVTTGETPRVILNFHDAEGAEIANMYVKGGEANEDLHYIPDTRDELDTIIYDPSADITLADYEVFYGWTTKTSYTVDEAESALAIEKIRDNTFATAQGLGAEDVTVDYYPVIIKSYTVDYLGDFDVVIGSKEIRFLPDDPEEQDFTVNQIYTPTDTLHNFEGWNVSKGDANIVGHTTGKVYENGDAIKIKGNVVFSVNAPEGCWLVFNENGKGATYYTPQFVKSGENTENPVTADRPMERLGYTFEGWYTEAEGGEEFTFGSPLEEPTTIYAHWTKNETADYTVLIWKQTADGEDYDFAEAVTLNGAVDTAINTVTATGTGNGRYASVDGTAKRYTGFHLNKYDENVTIKVEGTSVLNVYYDRNEITLTFLYRSGNSWATQIEMKGLYGSTLESNGYEWPTNRWWYDDYDQNWQGYYGTGTRTTFLDAFIIPSGADSETYYGFNGNGNNTIRFYKQNADGSWPALNSPTNSVTSSAGTFNISDKYNGYRAYEYSTNGTTWTRLGDKNPSTGYYASVSNYTNLYIRYEPLLYNILFMDGVYVDGDGKPVAGEESRGELKEVENIPYESSIASYNEGEADYYEPTYKGFIFTGWYIDENCTQEYTFNKMPEGLTVYAKWTQKQYRVFLHPNAGQDENLEWGDGVALDFRVDQGEKISLPYGLRIGYEFVGWFSDEATSIPFSADTAITEDTAAPYDKTEGTDYDKWGNPQKDNQDVDRPWVVGKVDLYGLWRETFEGAEGINLKYDPVGEDDYGDTVEGTLSAEDTRLYKDKSSATAVTAAEAPEGWRFEYWVLQTWDSSKSEYVDTDIHVYPGGAFDVLKADSMVQVKTWVNPEDEEDTVSAPNPPGDTTAPDKIHTKILEATYTIQLRAQYLKTGEETPTHIYWFNNDGTPAFHEDEPLQINEPVAIQSPQDRGAAYEFLGWARVEVPESGSSETTQDLDESDLYIFYNKDDGAFYADSAFTIPVEQVAADERLAYHDLFAVWKLLVADVTVEHYLKGETDPFKTDTEEDIQIGEKYSATPETTYDGKSLTVDSYDPSQEITVAEEDNLIKIYYTLPVTITTGSDSKEYDGTPLTNDEASIEGLITGDSATVTATGSQTEVGTSKNTYEIDWGTTNKEKYVITEELGTLEVTSNDEEVKLTAASDSKMYDGSALTNSEVTASGLPEGFTVEATATGTQTDAGSSKNVVDDGYVIKNADGEDVTANFTNVKKVDGTLEVTKRKVTLTSESASKEYDGIALERPDVTVGGDGFVEGEVTDIKATGSIIKVGEVTNTIEYTEADTFKADNYEITKNEGTLTITQNTSEIEVKSGSDEKMYDGTPLTNDEVEVTGGIPEGHDYEAVASGTITDAGKKANTIKTFKILNDKGEDVTDQFKNIKKTEGTLTVTKRNVTLTSATDEKAYDGTPLTNDEITVGGDGWAEGEGADYFVDGSQTYVGSSDNTFKYQLYGGTKLFFANLLAADDNAVTKEGNYNITKEYGTLTVTDEGADPAVKTHDGKEYGLGDVVEFEITVENIYAENKTITITEQEGVTITSQSVFKNVKPGEIVTATAEYTITEKDIRRGSFTNTATVTFSGVDKPYEPEDTVDTGDPDPHITLVKTTTSKPNNGKTYALGEEITYKITVKNDGNLTVKNIVVEDELTGDTWTIDRLKPGANKVFTASHVVTEDDILAGSVVNEVTGSADDDVPVKPGKTEDPTDPKNPSLDVEKTVTSTPKNGDAYTEGETISYQIKVVNDGNLTIKDIEVDDPLTGDNWTIKALKPGEEKTFKATYKVTEADVKKGKVANTVTVKGTDPEGDPVPDDDVVEVPVKKTDEPKKGDAPKTGDNNNMYLWLAVLLLSGGLMGSMVLTRRARRKEDE